MAHRPPVDGMSAAEFDAQRRRYVVGMFAEAERFMKLDNDFNEVFLGMTRSIAAYIAEHPEALDESDSIRLGGRAGAGESGGFKGGSFSGGGPIDVVGTITQLLKDEKEFIRGIVGQLLPF